MEINKNVEEDGVIFMSIKDKENAIEDQNKDKKNDEDVTILAIESSCDETAAAVVRNGREVLSNIISSQIALHTIYGGVVPEIASRKHVEKMNGCIRAALSEAGKTLDDIDAVAVTYGPGLVGALLVGVSEAKAISFATGKPLIGVHHIEGHISANFIENKDLEPPFACLIVSGGHTHLVMVEDYGKYEIVGRSRDDAAGEAFDKAARAMGFPYPGGVYIDKAAKVGDSKRYKLPRPHTANPYDFSFSGLKTSVINLVHNAEQKGEKVDTNDLAASFQYTVADILTGKFVAAANEYGYKTAAMAGGVAANSGLREMLEERCKASGITLYVPPIALCGDNAAMIGSQAYFEYTEAHITADGSLNAVASMPLQ